MSFVVLPPEINSLRMFIGAGTAPMLAAAAAWDGLAEELGTAAQSFASVTAGLAGQAWQGPAALAMAAAAAPYAGWLTAAAAQSAGAAGQARAVASIFEAAQAATVLPAAVAANRDAFVQLVMTNLFGQNAPLIAAAEGVYEEMWARMWPPCRGTTPGHRRLPRKWCRGRVCCSDFRVWVPAPPALLAVRASAPALLAARASAPAAVRASAPEVQPLAAGASATSEAAWLAPG